ncbi:MAG: ABC transporter permease [Clostridia bacterium]|nr:ABC transporter permease [Clostridia bacterium]MBP5592982.1 ABC transporter permease [Clostridia bacterium]MBP5648597.1 ABC transporter permease [Clostridia bacterium]
MSTAVKTEKKKPRFVFKRSFFSFPYIALNILFVVIPLAILLGYAFVGQEGEFSISNFAYFFSHIENIKTILFSLLMAALTTIICFVLAYPLAMCLADSKINKSAILVLMFILPMWVNSLLRTYALQNFLIDLFGMQRGFLSALIGLVYDFFPFMLLPLYTTLSNMDKSFVEASYDLGANKVMTFLKVTLPLSVPGIVSGVMMVFMPTMSTFSVTEIMGNTNTYMIGSMINEMINGGDWSGSAAFSFVLLILVGVTMVISNFITKGRGEAETGVGGII